MTFEQFQATRVFCDDLGQKLSDESLMGVGGQLYLDCLYIEPAHSIEGATGPYVLTLGNDQEFGELEALERKLYEWAESEGYFETDDGDAIGRMMGENR